MAHIAFARSRSTHRGLLDADSLAQLPLTAASVDVDGHWSLARVTVRMTFRNITAASAKVFAAVDVPAGWSLLSMRYETPGHHVKSSVRHLATDPSAAPPFTGPVAALDVPWALAGGHVAHVTAIYAGPVDLSTASLLTLSLPAELVPLCHAAPADAESWKGRFTIAAPAASAAAAAQQGLTLRGTLTAPHPVASAPTTVGLEGLSGKQMGDARRVELSFAADDVAAFRSCVVTVPLEAPEDPVTLHVAAQDSAAEEDRYAIAVAVTPALPSPAALQAPNTDLVIAIDCSGSMHPYAPAVEAAVRSIAGGLPASAHVNVVCFGETQAWLMPQARRPDDATLGLLRGLHVRADMGTTRLHDALASVYLRPVVAGAARGILLITDGAEQQQRGRLVDLVAANRGNTRVAAVSVGPYADTALLQEVADASGGAHLPASSPTDVAACVGVAAARLLVPCLSFATVNYHVDGSADPPPVRRTATLPLVPMGSQAVVYGLAPASFGGCTVTVSGLMGTDHVEFTAHTGDLPRSAAPCPAPAGDVTQASVLHTAAAAARITSLCDDSEASAVCGAEAAEVARLSEAFGLLSTMTAHRCHTEAGPADPRMLFAPAPQRQRAAASTVAPAVRDAAGSAVDGDAVYGAVVRQEAAARSALSAADAMAGVVAAMVSTVLDPPTVDDLLVGQQASGAWRGDDVRVAKVLAMTQEVLGTSTPPEVAALTTRHRLEAERRRAQAATRIAVFQAMVQARAQREAAAAEEPAEEEGEAEEGAEEEAEAEEEPAVTAEELEQLAAEVAQAESAMLEDPGRSVWATALAAAALEKSFANDPRSAPAAAKASLFLGTLQATGAAAQRAASTLVR